MKITFRDILETIKLIFVAGVIVVPIRIFIFQPFLVQGASMEPNLETGDYLIVDEITYRFRPPQRGEMVVFKYPQDPSKKFIKRIIGLPGEDVEIREGKVYIDGKPLKEDYLPENILTFPDQKIKLKENEYFVLGDNRNFSLDSRIFGPLPRKNIIGRAITKIFRINFFILPNLSFIKTPKY